MAFDEKLMSLDRRWVYLLVGVAVVIPVLVPFSVPVTVTSEVKAIYDFVEETKPGEIIFLAIDYDPQAKAELHPMAYSIMRQCFAKGVKLLISALSQNGPGMAEQAIGEVAREMHKVRGEDYVYLGYKPYFGIVILAMGQDFRIPFPEDYYGTPLDSLPMMEGVRNYDDVKGVIELSAGNITDAWIAFANGRYQVPVSIGVTGVMAADYYPYLQSGQIFGLMGGMKGAAEYEALTGRSGEASSGMPIQTVAHSLIIALILIGNVGYFLSRRKARKA
jgi:hypothetical protein